MSVSSILGAVAQPVPATGGAEAIGRVQDTQPGQGSTDFGQALSQALDGVNSQLQSADNEVQALVRGDSVELHRAMMSLEKADVSVRLMTQVGSRVVDAYREILRLNV